MHPECPKCGLNYDPEPGYYFGAMFVSYALNVAIFVLVWLAFYLFASDDLNVWWIVLFSVIVGLVLTPVTFRYSRLVWINFFVKYRKT